MLKINVYYGSESFSYQSLIAPIIGDCYPKVDKWGNNHFTVVKRLLVTEPDFTNLITVIVEKTIK